MDTGAHAIDNERRLDDLTYEPVRVPELDLAMDIILESLRRRQPTITIS